MKKLAYLLLLCACAVGLGIGSDQADAAEKTVYFTDTHEILHGNPYSGTAFDINSHRMGTTGYTFTTDPAITDFINGTKTIPADADIVRLQIAWSDFEPADDQFTWDRLDAFMNRINEQGKTVEFQLLMSEAPDIANDPSVFQYEYPPAWLFDEKGAGYRMAPYNGIYYSKQPIYYDPIFLSELDEAVSAFGARYDTNPGMAWVDLRAFSLFGEWSGWDDAQNFPWPDNATRQSTLEAIIDIYKNAFSHTMVMMPNPGANVILSDSDADTQQKRYRAFGFEHAAANEGWGFRSDTVNSAFAWMNYDPRSQSTWNNRLLRRDHIQVSEGAGWDSSIMLNNPRLVVKNAIEAYHTNLQGINNTGFAEWDNMKAAYGEWFTTLARYSGYRFVMPRATYNDKVAPGGSLALTMSWINNGAGFSPKNYALKVYFTNPSTGEVVWSGTDASLNQRKWFKGDVNEVESTFVLPASLAVGAYDLSIAMVDAAGNPKIELAMPNGDGKRYKIGEIEVASAADPYETPAPLIQFRVEGENYTASNYTTDSRGAYGVEAPPEGGFGAVYMDTAEYWAEYGNVDVPASGTYTVEFRISSEEGNRFRVEVDGADALGSVVVPDTGGYNLYRTVERQITLSEGRHTIKIIREDGRWFFLNWMRFTLSTPDEIKIQAELPSDQDGTWLLAGDAAEDDGTVGVSVIDTGDWLQYDGVQVAHTGDYLFQMRYSTVNGDPLKFKLLVDGVDATGELSLDDTGGVKKMKTADFIVPLTAGTHSLKIVWTEAYSSIVWNWMKFNRQGSFSQTIEAENYNMQWNLLKEYEWEGKETGVVVGAYSDNGQPVAAVGKFDRNDYVRYENVLVPYTGFYLFEFRVASGEAQSFRFETDGDSTMVRVPNTGGEGSLENVSKWIKLSAGMHDFRIVYDSQPTGDGMLLDKFTLTAGIAGVKAVVANSPAELNAGDTAQITAEAVYMDGSRGTVTAEAQFESSDPSVATVDATGTITAIKWGTTVLTVYFEGVSASYTLNVKDSRVDLILVNDTDPAITYTGNFGMDSGRPFGDYMDDIHYSVEEGDYYEYEFEGTGIVVLSEKFTDVGTIDVYIDGALQGSADGYWPTRLVQQSIFRADGLSNGTHKIKVVNRSTYATSGKIAILDGFIVERPKPAAPQSKLIGLVLSAGKLAPPFEEETMSYQTDVGNQVSSLTVTPTISEAAVSRVTVGLCRQNGATLQAPLPVVSGTASERLALPTGKSVIRIVVTSQDSTTKTYTVTVNRASIGGGGSSGGSTPTPSTTTPSENQSPDGSTGEPSTGTNPATTFSDTVGHWAEAHIKKALVGGIVTGYPDGTFRPNRTVTRAEFTVMLMKMLKLPGDEAALTFTDNAKIGAWAQKAIAQAVQAGIINGYGDGSFRPDAEITRAEMVKMLANALGLSGDKNAATGFTDDESIPAWARGAVAAIKKLGVVQGKGSNEFDPAAGTTRAEAITVLMRLSAHKIN